MKIPHDQFDRLLQQDAEAFIGRIMEAVHDAHPAYRESDAMRRASVIAGVKRARAHGLTSDEDLMAYVLMMYSINPNFDQQPQIAAALADTSVSPHDRWDRIFGEDFDDAWEEAATWEFRDGAYWLDPDLPPAAPEDDAPLTEADWAELVVALKQAQQGDGPYPAASPEDLAQAKEELRAALLKRARQTPEELEAEARALAERLRSQAPSTGKG
ncbi:hypothetical protein [Rhizobacter sp. LjRoot28]|uniref:hypothetical protein n=1 Tax=Rhizobacter sp. LjRoot28 TaxID=3342309 RepID=UPI003ECF729C